MPARLILGQPRLETVELGADRGRPGTGGDGPFVCRRAGGIGPAGDLAGRLQRRPSPARSASIALAERGPRARKVRLQACPSFGRGRGLGRLVGGPALDLGETPSGRLALGLARGGRTSEGGQLLALRLLGAAQRPEFGQRIGQLAFGLAHGLVEQDVGRWDGRRQGASAGGDLGLGGGPLVEQALALAGEGLELRGEPRVAQLGAGRGGPRRVVRLAPFALETRPDTEFRGQPAAVASAAVSSVIAVVDRRGRHVAIRIARGQSRGRLVPAGVHRDRGARSSARRRSISRVACCSACAASRRACGRSSPRMSSARARFASDSDQLLLGAATTAFVAPDAGHLLEQRPTFLRPERQRLVDHPLPDEQERVVRQMRGIEQVDQVAQPDPALVEQVVVLARAIQPATEFEDAELDRQQAVGVVEDERDVGHPLRRPLLRAGPDDVLRLARPEGPTLLAERPAQGIGEVALARPVGADDGADAGAEFDARPLGERLEALQSGGPAGAAGPADRAASSGASVEPGGPGTRSPRAAGPAPGPPRPSRRRDATDPSPLPSISPSTQTSIRNDFSWSGPVASTSL